MIKPQYARITLVKRVGIETTSNALLISFADLDDVVKVEHSGVLDNASGLGCFLAKPFNMI